eukprot:798539_1
MATSHQKYTITIIILIVIIIVSYWSIFESQLYQELMSEYSNMPAIRIYRIDNLTLPQLPPAVLLGNYSESYALNMDLYSLSSIQRTAIRSSLSSHHPSTISISETSTLTLVSSCRKCATMICVQNRLNFPFAAFSLADIITMTNYSLTIRFLFLLFCLMTIDATANDTRRDRASKDRTRLFSDGFGYEKHCNALLHNKTEKSRDELGLAMLLNACNCQASDFDDGILVINTPCTGTIN